MGVQKQKKMEGEVSSLKDAQKVLNLWVEHWNVLSMDEFGNLMNAIKFFNDAYKSGKKMTEQQVADSMNAMMQLKGKIETQIYEGKAAGEKVSHLEAAVEEINKYTTAIGLKEGMYSIEKGSKVKVSDPSPAVKFPIPSVPIISELEVDIRDVDLNPQLIVNMHVQEDRDTLEGQVGDAAMAAAVGDTTMAANAGRQILQMLADSCGMSYEDFVNLNWGSTGPLTAGEKAVQVWGGRDPTINADDAEAISAVIDRLLAGDVLGAINAGGEKGTPIGDTLIDYLEGVFEQMKVPIPTVAVGLGLKQPFVGNEKAMLAVQAEFYSYFCNVFNPILTQTSPGVYTVDFRPTGETETKFGGTGGVALAAQLKNAHYMEIEIMAGKDAFLNKKGGVMKGKVTFYGAGDVKIKTLDLTFYYSAAVAQSVLVAEKKGKPVTAGPTEVTGDLMVGLAHAGPIGFFLVGSIDWMNYYMYNKAYEGKKTATDQLTGKAAAQIKFPISKEKGIKGAIELGALFPGTIKGKKLKPGKPGATVGFALDTPAAIWQVGVQAMPPTKVTPFPMEGQPAMFFITVGYSGKKPIIPVEPKP